MSEWSELCFGIESMIVDYAVSRCVGRSALFAAEGWSWVGEGCAVASGTELVMCMMSGMV